MSPPTKNGNVTLKKADNGGEKIYTFRKTERTNENPGVMDKELQFLCCPAGVFENNYQLDNKTFPAGSKELRI